MGSTLATLVRRGAATLGVAGAGALVYQVLVRRVILNWGATEAEAHARLPGDELLEEADGVATRAITITRLHRRSGRGSHRWGRCPAAAPTPTIGSRTCSARYAQRRLRASGISASPGRRHARLREEPHAH